MGLCSADSPVLAGHPRHRPDRHRQSRRPLRPHIVPISIKRDRRHRQLLGTAARTSQVELPDGALFTPVELLDGTQPWDPITGTTLGGYFNLTAYYGFAARVYEPGSDEAQRTLRYVLNYGSRLLGLLRARDSADDTVYEVEQLKFLADNDEADQIVLTFYGKLAHGMTRGTFESHNIGPMLTKWPSCREQPGRRVAGSSVSSSWPWRGPPSSACSAVAICGSETSCPFPATSFRLRPRHMICFIQSVTISAL